MPIQYPSHGGNRKQLKSRPGSPTSPNLKQDWHPAKGQGERIRGDRGVFLLRSDGGVVHHGVNKYQANKNKNKGPK